MLPLSFAHQRLWFLDQLEPGSPVYNIPAVVELTGRLDAAVLAAALGEVVRRHETLRTTFRSAAGEPVQVVAEDAGFLLPVVDLQALPGREREHEAHRLATAEARRPFDLARGPLLRAALLRSGTEQHVVLLTMHHIVSDGWSMGVLVRELGVLYEALVAGRPSPLLELALQYADFAAWQRQSLSGARLESELAWWRGQLAGMPAALDLPADHPRPVALSTRGAVRELALDGECLAGLNGLARRHGATLFMTLLAGFAGLLWRCTGQDDLAVGTPVAGRTRAETEPLIGFFVNTLVLRLDLAGEPSFEQLLERVRETTLSAYAHQEIPFERLVEELVAQRDRSRPPLVQVMFALQNAPLGVLALPGLELRAVQAGTGTAMFELTFVLGETASGLAGMIEYSTDLFEAPTTGRLAGHFERLLAAAVAGPEQRLDDLALLSEAERHQLLVEWGAAPRDTPRRTSLFALFAASAERAPDAVAVVSGGERLTYGELDARSARWARHLRRCGTGPETIVGVCLEPSPDLLVALLAIWRAGGAFLPLDPAYPLERLAFMLEDSGAPLVVTRGVPLDLAVPGVRRIGLDDLAADSSPDPAEPAVVRPEDLAYVIYTSGSTGRPKGVAVQQGEAAAHIETIVADWELGSADRVLQFASPSFDVWIEETVPPLVAGATLVLRGTELWEPAWFLDRARELGLTVIDLPTAYWHQWVREGLAGEGPEAVPADLSLRLVVVGGEAMSVEAARLWWRSPLCGVRLVNSYGPTEAVITATSCVVGAACAAVASASLGPPLPGRSALVLDRGGHLQPVGVPGELCVGGGVLARGYLHRPDLTAERFVPDPFSSSPGGRLYRTGDLARHLPDGRLESLGRIDHQVKVRGFRIELGEIEAALLAHRGVKAAAVLAGGEPAGGASLVAYAVVSPGETPGEPLGPSALRDFLRERLPPYMVPSFFVNLPALPLTPGGKVDRKALRALGPQTGPVETAVGRPPRTPTEELVAGIFADVLGLERVGSEDDFFELGGHSLLATRVTARVQAVFGVELPVRAVFEAPTVAGLAGRLEGAAGDRPRKPAIARVSRQEPLPLSFAQQRLWFLDQLEPGSPVYNIPAAVELTGRLDVAVLAAALGEVVRRHEALRTTFQVVVGEPVQGVAEDAGFALPLVDLQALPGCEREARRLAVAEARRPFDLGCGPLLRATVLRTGAERHVLLVTMHHIVSDGWSMGVLVRELGVLYGALVAGRPSPLPELALQYVDFAAWQRQALSGARMGLDLAWWRGQLAGMAPAVDLPTDHPRPATRSVRGAVHRFAIDREGLSGLMALSRRHGATLFMTLLAGFAALLQRITGQDNLAVGTPVAGRTVVETEPLIGLFVNTLVLRVDLAGDPELAELLGRVRETALSALAHQEMPFERLVEELVEERDPSRPPLVQVLLALQNAPEGPLELPGLALTSSPVETGTARLELACALTETEGGLEGEIEYSRDLFDGTTVARMAGHFVRLLAGAVDGPRRRLSGLPLLSAGERQQLLEWNATATPYRLDRSLHELIEEQVRRTPAAPAVVAEDESLAYGEFNGRANRLARRLRDCGVGPETVVAICAERSAALVVGLLAILKAGGAYLPLDPDYPTERLLFMLQDARASLLLTTGELAARLGEQGPAILRLDDRTAPWWSPERDAGGNLGIAVQPGNLAYVIYTSGSTGRPKGTMNAHLGIVNRLLWMQERFDLGPGDRVLQKTPVSFDVSVWELFWPLINGAILVMARPGGHRDAAYLWRTIEEHGITTLHFVPSMLRAFLEGAPPSAERLSASSLVRVLASGETLGHDLQELYSSRLEAPLYNLYGPTEAAVDVTHWSCDPADARPLVPIGRPVANTCIHLLDRQAQEVPVGVPGELYIGGVQVARGYLGRPDLTAERFVPDVGGARLYRTGDLARYLPDGAIDYLGRCDDQVKIRGFRIELGEIEAVLAGHPAVREAAVLLRTDLPGGSGLVAYVAADEAGRGRSLRGWLEERLPGYMVPAAFVELESLPLSVNGKVDRKALAKLRPERETSLPMAPRTPAEELLAGIFAEVLGVDRVGITEDFFALGGHSLLATRVASRVRTVFGVELPVRAIFQAPTVEALAGHLERSARAVGGRIERSERRGEPLALSFAQQRLWVLDQLEPGSPLYSIPVAVELIGRLEEAALAAALEEVVRRHEALRTTFRSVEGEPVQVIAEPTAFTLPQVDLRGLPVGEGREREVSRLAEDEARRPFDLGCDPLLRCTLVRAGADAHVLLLTMHHIVSDAWSIDVLVRELGALYASFAAGRPSPLPELPIQYADFAAWQRHHLAGGLLAAELAWWRGQLAGIPPALELPTDHPRPVDRSVRGAVHDFTIDREELAGLTRLSRRHGTTLFMTVLAGFAALLQRFTDQDDVVVGTPVAGRTRTETEPLIGFFINTLALRIDLSGAPVFVDLLARVRETALSAYAHQDVPFERLVEELAPERDRSRPPIFQVVLALQNAPSERLTLPGLEVQVLPLSTGTAKFELSVVLGETAQGLTGMIEFSRDLFAGATIGRLAGHLTRLLAAAVADPHRPLPELSLLSPGERHQLLLEWNDTRAPFPETLLLHQFFEVAVERAPEAVAAVCAGSELTYAGLEARSNRLAWLLRERGVQRGTPVGIWVERGFDMLTTVLGILKAGGHYVALDEAWPADRVESILAATGAPAIIAGAGLLEAVEEMRWRLPALSDVVCLAIADPELPAEVLDAESVRELWDFVAERAVDRVTAGGFVSAFTGEPMSEAEVDEYRDRVLSLSGPWLRPEDRVLEIGNGSGLLLWEVAFRVAHVTGIDPSPLTQERNRERAVREGIANVELRTGFAHEIDEILGAGERFDLVLLASTVQFFPGPYYLERVVRQALARLAPGGALVIADVLDARRREELRRAIGEHRGTEGGASSGPGRELYLDEEFFKDLGATVHHRTEGFANELRFRYDVLFTAGPAERRKRLWTGWHVDRCSAGRLPSVAGPDDIAYVIHTSGSTGEPKGIAVQHRPAANLIDWVNRTFDVGPEDCGLFVTSLCFDLSVYDIFGLLAAGGTVHVALEEDLGDPDRLVSLLRTGGITLWDSAPAALVQLAPLFPAAPEPSSRLRRVLLSGDWIPVTLPDRVRRAFPEARVMALGGATEATVWSNWFPVGSVDPEWPSIPYGRPIANARYHVLDAGFSPCPIGIPGDLYIGGDCLCTGYARRPDLTAQAFLPDPFSDTPGARLYRTGDRARAHADGNLEFLGRLDQQVKVRGYRIELGEIEVALCRDPGVREAVVLAREDTPGDQRLVAYVVPQGERTAGPSPADLRDHLRRSLPEYMIPAGFVTLAELPVTANGKLDRRALPPPQWGTGTETGSAAALTPVEEIVARLWAEVLGLPRVGPDDNFFELGGHSLSGTQVVSRLRQAFQVDLPLRALFAAPTVAGLAAEIEARRGPDRVPEQPVIASFRRDRSAPPPLSFAQERFWAARQAEARSRAPHTIPMMTLFEGELDVALLRQALQGIVDRHEAMRTSFREDPAGRPVQVVHPVLPVVLPVVDLREVPVADRMAVVRDWGILAAQQPFDYERVPLFRLFLFRCSQTEHVLFSVVHHITFDGWSSGLLSTEIAALYNAFRSGRPSPLAPLPLQYQDFARWQRHTVAGEALDRQVAFWREHLDSALPLDLGGGRQRPKHPQGAGIKMIVVPKDLERKLEDFAAEHCATLFMTLLAAFNVLLHFETGRDDIVVVCLFANRDNVETEGLIGNFYAGLPLRTRLAGVRTFRELLEQVREVTLAAHEHPDILYERVFDGMSFQDEADPGGLSTFRVLFQLAKLPAGRQEDLDGLKISRLPFATETMRADLSLFLFQESRLNGRFRYNRDVLTTERAVRLRDRYLEILAAVAADADRPIAELLPETVEVELS
ncbi:MAG TPA: amino acid adenylation domain-containing protein [Thermoanaerobaculia bacterium]|nr:amino acid adenylation domain-containing protein [Thermoanaerobaculia bacterium]